MLTDTSLPAAFIEFINAGEKDLHGGHQWAVKYKTINLASLLGEKPWSYKDYKTDID